MGTKLYCLRHYAISYSLPRIRGLKKFQNWSFYNSWYLRFEFTKVCKIGFFIWNEVVFYERCCFYEIYHFDFHGKSLLSTYITWYNTSAVINFVNGHFLILFPFINSTKPGKFFLSGSVEKRAFLRPLPRILLIRSVFRLHLLKCKTLWEENNCVKM